MNKAQAAPIYDADESKRLIMRVSWVSLWLNTALAVGKLLAGVLASSGALISDGVHSVSDVFSSVLVMFGINMAAKAEDDDHPYGHERLECVTALVLALLLLGTALGIGWQGICSISLALQGQLAVPGKLALLVSALAIVVKEGMFHYTRRAAVRTNSGALMAGAWDNRSDALASLGGLVGILGARLGLPVLDPIAALIICLLILKVAYDIMQDALDKMVDHACDDEVVEQIRQLTVSTEGVQTLDDLKTRRFGSKSYVDIEIGVDPTLSVVRAHDIAHALHDRIEQELPQVKHCMVHINPNLPQYKEHNHKEYNHKEHNNQEV